MKKKRNQLILSLLNNKKTDPYNDENAIDFRWSDVQEEEEEDIALANFIENLQKQANKENFQKKSNYMIAVSYLMKRKIKKIFLELISNIKIFNIIFFNEITTTKILPNLQGDWKTSNTVH